MSKFDSILIRSEELEEKQHKKDLWLSLGLNGLFLILLIVLYFVNQQTGFINKLADKYLKF